MVEILSTLVYFFVIECVGYLIYSIYIHREIIHKYWVFHPALSSLFRFYLWLKSGHGHWESWQKQLAAIHRKHHRFSDTEHDPISAKVHSIKKVLSGKPQANGVHWVSPEDIEKYASDVPVDNSWAQRKIYKHKNLGKILFWAIVTLIFNFLGFIYGLLNFFFVDRLGIYLSTVWLHRHGNLPANRNKNNLDLSKNSYPWGSFLAGEELHSNHHDDPTNPNFAKKWYEIDIGFCFTKFLSWFGLVKFH